MANPLSTIGTSDLTGALGLGNAQDFGGNVVADVASVPGNLLGGDGVSNPIADTGYRVDQVLFHTDNFVNSLGSDLTTGGAPLDRPLDVTSNLATADLHLFLERIADNVGIPGTAHGVTTLGNVAGVSNLGGDNLVTDVINAPSDLLTSPTTPNAVIDNIVTDAGPTLDVAPGPVTGAVSDVTNDLALGGLLGNNGAVAAGDQFHLPVLGGDGVDSLAGVLTGGADAGAGNTNAGTHASANPNGGTLSLLGDVQGLADPLHGADTGGVLDAHHLLG